MPWMNDTRVVAATGLRHAALAGEFVPYVWNDGIMTTKDGGCSVFGCGWGQIAWTIAVYLGGTAYARQMLPVGSDQTAVNRVLMAAGLTQEEIDLMEPQEVWEYFDQDLDQVYQNREKDPEAFIETSIQLAEFFIDVLETIPEVAQQPVAESRARRRRSAFSGMLSAWMNESALAA